MVNQPSTVAPARERGLKCHGTYNREGSASRRSREGAWIEMTYKEPLDVWHLVAPARERGLKFDKPGPKQDHNGVAPARERGLK